MLDKNLITSNTYSNNSSKNKKSLDSYNLEKKKLQEFYSFYWKVRNKLNKRILRMTPKDRKLFMEKYGDVYDFADIRSVLEKKTLKNMKVHNQMTSKRYKSLLEYKRSKLDNQNNYPKWDLYDEIWDKKFSNVSHFTNWHVKKYYVVKKTISFFYGYLKHKKLKQIFVKTSRQKNKILSFLLHLESFLVTVLFRMGFVLNFMQGKQFIRHGFILLNNKKIIYRFYKVKKNDVITYNYVNYNKFMSNNQESSESLLKTFLYKKTLFPHLWVNRRIMLGIILHNPNIYYQVLLNQHPNLFFNSVQSESEYQYGQQNKDRKQMYDRFLFQERTLQKENKRGRAVDIFDKTFKNIRKILNKHKLPVQNIKLVLAYMIKQ